MTHSSNLNSDQSLSNLTVADLENLVVAILPRLLKPYLAFPHALSEEDPADATQPPVNVLETFGTWDDDQLTETIISEIYASRTAAGAEYTP